MLCALVLGASLPLGAQEEDEDIPTITITEKLKPDSQEAILLERKETSAVSDAIGGSELSKKDAGDVAEGVKSLPGVSIKGGQFAFIRGLGERYSQTLFNMSVIPSPEPDKRVIPLDLFPSNLVERIVITKTYTPDTPAEFAGGSVQIHSVGIPDEAFFKIGLSLKYVDGTTFEDFATYEGGNYDAFTFNDSTRDLPDEIPQQPVKVGDTLDAQEIQELGRSFPNIWNTETRTAPAAHKLSLNFGRQFDLGPLGTFGAVGAVNWANKYQFIEDEKLVLLKNEGSIEAPDPQPFNDFTLNTYTFTSELSTMLNLAYRPNDAQEVGVRNFYTRSMDDRTRFQTGLDGQEDREIRVTNLRNVERSLFVSQLYGEHLLIGDLFAEWRTSYALSQRDEPDNRQVRYDFRTAVDDFVFENDSGSGRRTFFLLDENIYDGGADLSIPLPFELPWVDYPDISDQEALERLRPRERIKVGGAYVYRDRDFNARNFRFVPSSLAGRPQDENGNPIDLTALPEDLFRPKNINPRGFIVSEETRPTDNYEATQLILAGYGMVEFDILNDLRLQAGVRYERSRQRVTTFELFGDPPEEVEAELDDGDVLPAANLTWSFLEDHKLRLGASRTVSRPEFRELAEFQFQDVAQGFIAKGNPELERATLMNFDLRWEWYPSPRELISVSVFYKDFDKPIERVIIPTGSSLLTSWENADSAELYGFEIEARKSLGFIEDLFRPDTPRERLRDDAPDGLDPEAAQPSMWRRVGRSFTLHDVMVIANFAVIESEVEIQEQESGVVQTNNNRPLEGQPEYVLNVGLLYDSPELGLTMAILANTFGESISQVGAFGLPDETFQPRWSLDFNISKRFGQSSVKLSVENLLDEAFSYEQGGFTTREYRRGVSVGLSYSYTF